MSEAASNHQSKKELYREEIANLRETVRDLEGIVHIKLAEVGEIDSLRAKVKELESQLEGLKDPNAVWTNMLRGTIAFPQHLKAAEGSVYEPEQKLRIPDEIRTCAEITCDECNDSYQAQVIRVRELEEAIPSAERLGILAGYFAYYQSLRAAKELMDMADGIEKVMAKK